MLVLEAGPDIYIQFYVRNLRIIQHIFIFLKYTLLLLSIPLKFF